MACVDRLVEIDLAEVVGQLLGERDRARKESARECTESWLVP